MSEFYSKLESLGYAQCNATQSQKPSLTEALYICKRGAWGTWIHHAHLRLSFSSQSQTGDKANGLNRERSRSINPTFWIVIAGICVIKRQDLGLFNVFPKYSLLTLLAYAILLYTQIIPCIGECFIKFYQKIPVRIALCNFVQYQIFRRKYGLSIH